MGVSRTPDQEGGRGFPGGLFGANWGIFWGGGVLNIFFRGRNVLQVCHWCTYLRCSAVPDPLTRRRS